MLGIDMAYLNPLQKSASLVMNHSYFQTNRDTIKVWNLVTEVKANALHFMKITWAFLWQKKQISNTPFTIAAHLFAGFMIDTLAAVSAMKSG